MAVKSFLGADNIDEWRPKSLALRWGGGSDVGSDDSGGTYASGDVSGGWGGDFGGGFGGGSDSWSGSDSFGGSFDSGGGAGSDFSSAFDSGGGGVAFGDAGVGPGGFGTGDFGGAFDGGGYFGGSDSNFTGDFGGGGGWGEPGFADYGGGGFSDYGGGYLGGGGWDSGFPGVSYADAPFSAGWGGYDGGFNAGTFGGPSFGISGPGDVFGGLYGGLYGGPGETLSGMDIAGDLGRSAIDNGNSLAGVTGGMPSTSLGYGPPQGAVQNADAVLAGPGLLLGAVPGSVLGGAAITGGIVGGLFSDRGGQQFQSPAQTLPDVQIVADRPDIPNPLAQPQQPQSNFGPAQTAQAQSQFGPEVSQAPNNATTAQAAPSPGIMQQAPPNMQEAQGAPPQTAPPNMQVANPFAAPTPSMALPSVEASKVGELVGTPGQVAPGDQRTSEAARSLLDMTPQQMNAALLEAAKPGSVTPPTVWDRVADFFTPSQAEAGNPLADIVKALRTGPFAAMPGNQVAQQAEQVARDQQWFTKGASPTDKYLADVYNRTPQKVDSTGDFTWKDAAAANYYGKGTTEYAIGGLHPDFKTVLEAMGKAMDRAGIPWSMSAAYRENARQSITEGFRAGPTGSLHGGTGRLGGDPNNPISTYGKGRAVDVTGVERGPQKNDNQKVWDFIDKYGQQFGVTRPMKGRDPPHLQPTDKLHQIAQAIRGGFDPMSRTAFAPTAQPGKSSFGPEGGQPGRSFVNGKEFTFYAPGTKGGAKGEGKFVGSRDNPLTTLDDVRADPSKRVSLAGHPSQYGQEVDVGDVTYRSPKDGKTYTIPNVKGVVEDTGGKFDDKDNPEKNKFDIAVGDFRGIRGGAKFVSNNSVRASEGTQVAFAPSPAVPLPTARPMQATSPVPNIPGVTLPAFQPIAPAVPSQPSGGRLAQPAPPAREAPQALPNARFAPQAPPGRELQQDQPRSVAFLPPQGEIPQAPFNGQNVPQAPGRGAELSPALSYELLPNLDPGGLHGATPGTSPLASGWLASQQSRGPAFPGWASVGNPLSGGEFGGLLADYGENYGAAGPPTAPSRGVTGSPPGLPGTLPGPYNPADGATGSPSGLPGDYTGYGPGEGATGSPSGLPGSEGDYQGYGQEGVPMSAMPTAPAVPDTVLAPRSPDSAAPQAFKPEPILSPEKQFDVNSKTISSKFNLTAEQKQSGKDFFSGLTAKERAAIVEGKINIMDLIARKAVEQHPWAAKIVDIPAKAREFVEQNYPGGLRGLERDATYRDMTQPTPSGIQSELARPGGAEVYDDQGVPTAAMPTAPSAPPGGMPSWLATPSANTTQPGSLAGMFGTGFVPGGQFPSAGFVPGGGNFGGRGATGDWGAKGDLQPNDFNSRFGDWAPPQAFAPESPATPPTIQEAQQAAQSDPQTAQQIAQANPQAVQQVAQQLGVDILTAAMILAMEERPRFMPPGDNGSGFGRWPQLPTPDHPGQFAGLGREMVRQNYEAQNPINSLAAMIESGGMQFNPASWDAVLAHAPYSQNVEDRRNQMTIGMR